MYREIEGEDVILEKDPTYVLTVADIEQYASWLGMDLELDAHLFWIAKAGLMTELPEDWKPCKSPDGEVYYFNFATGESQWDHPCDEEFRELYREQRVDFGDVLATRMESTHHAHLAVGADQPGWRVGVDRNTPVRADGNGVDLDREAVKIAANNLRYDAIATMVQAELAQLDYAARDGR